MSELKVSGDLTFSAIMQIRESRAICPVHGEVGGDFHVCVTGEPEYDSGKICPKCYVDWVKANVSAVTPKPSPITDGGAA